MKAFLRWIVGFCAIIVLAIGLWEAWLHVFAVRVELTGPLPTRQWVGENTFIQRGEPFFYYGERSSERLSFDPVSGLWFGYPSRDGAVVVRCFYHGVSSGEFESKPRGYVTLHMSGKISLPEAACLEE